MMIHPVTSNKKAFLELLLLADEQESMIDTYLEQGTLFVLWEEKVTVGVCVVCEESAHVLEIKNLAILPSHQRKGYGSSLVRFVIATYQQHYDRLQVGTGDSPQTILFYEQCGFVKSHCIPNFFIDHYDHPIFEAGVQLRDMIYLTMKMKGT